MNGILDPDYFDLGYSISNQSLLRLVSINVVPEKESVGVKKL
jgi:hypothetical protein